MVVEQGDELPALSRELGEGWGGVWADEEVVALSDGFAGSLAVLDSHGEAFETVGVHSLDYALDVLLYAECWLFAAAASGAPLLQNVLEAADDDDCGGGAVDEDEGNGVVAPVVQGRLVGVVYAYYRGGWVDHRLQEGDEAVGCAFFALREEGEAIADDEAAL